MMNDVTRSSEGAVQKNRQWSDDWSCRLDDATFPFWSEQGGLREHWYAITFSKGVLLNKPKRQNAFGIPIVLWRQDSTKISAFVDICPHRQAPLSQGVADANRLTCPYHGWRFDVNGKCNNVPVDSSNCKTNSQTDLLSLPCIEQSGVVWIWLGKEAPKSTPPKPALDGPGWRSTYETQVLLFDLDDLIENFMDFAHTPIVHPGLIRGIGTAIERGVTIVTTEYSVCATHDPVDEKVGFLSRQVVPPGKVHHSDTFLMPSNVTVDYRFGNNPPSFIARLYMTPIAQNETLLLISLNTRFGVWNPLVGIVLPFLMRKVLTQDIHILKHQRSNLDLMGKRSRRSLQSDAVDSIVRAMREHERTPTRTRPKPGVRRIVVRV